MYEMYMANNWMCKYTHIWNKSCHSNMLLLLLNSHFVKQSNALQYYVSVFIFVFYFYIFPQNFSLLPAFTFLLFDPFYVFCTVFLCTIYEQKEKYHWYSISISSGSSIHHHHKQWFQMLTFPRYIVFYAIESASCVCVFSTIQCMAVAYIT